MEGRSKDDEKKNSAPPGPNHELSPGRNSDAGSHAAGIAESNNEEQRNSSDVPLGDGASKDYAFTVSKSNNENCDGKIVDERKPPSLPSAHDDAVHGCEMQEAGAQAEQAEDNRATTFISAVEHEGEEPFRAPRQTDGTDPDQNPTNVPNEQAAQNEGSEDNAVPLCLIPGAHQINGPGYTGDEDEVLDADVNAVYDAYVPEKRPTKRQILRHLIANAITLEDSAVQPVRDDREERHEEQRNERVKHSADEKKICGISYWIFLAAVSMLLLLLGIALIVTNVSNKSQEPSEIDVAFDPCEGLTSTNEDSLAQYDMAKEILSEVTDPTILSNLTTPQGKALQWIVCTDQLSYKLFSGANPSTGELPKQTNGFVHGGDSGEAQVIRRYALATFYFSTTINGPWDDDWNFLTPDIHECGWHKNYTRGNFPYGDFDPAGFLCENLKEIGTTILLDDAVFQLQTANFNFRIPNNVSGTIPDEFGYIVDFRAIGFENQKGLTGSLPSTIGNLAILDSFSLALSGSGLGGEIPPSLFTLPELLYVTIQYNDGNFSLPASIGELEQPSKISSLKMAYTGLFGTLPSFFSELHSIKDLDLEGNALEGSIPDLASDYASLEYISFYGNNLGSTLPSSLGNLPNITAMVLGSNNFVGSIPSSYGNLKKLVLLDLSRNQLEGSIPPSFSELANLKYVTLKFNKFKGSIKPLSNLTFVSLYSNSFSGSLPSGLLSTTEPTLLADLGHNNFEGSLPEDFLQLAPHISYLSLMANDLNINAVDDVLCQEVPYLFADCESCNCCDTCCSLKSNNDNFCYIDIGIRKYFGLECGPWWHSCKGGEFNLPYDPLPTDDP